MLIARRQNRLRLSCSALRHQERFHLDHVAIRAAAHDRFGTGWMLQTDAISAILFIVAVLFLLHKINAARAQVIAADKSCVG